MRVCIWYEWIWILSVHVCVRVYFWILYFKWQIMVLTGVTYLHWNGVQNFSWITGVCLGACFIFIRTAVNYGSQVKIFLPGSDFRSDWNYVWVGHLVVMFQVVWQCSISGKVLTKVKIFVCGPEESCVLVSRSIKGSDILQRLLAVSCSHTRSNNFWMFTNLLQTLRDFLTSLSHHFQVLSLAHFHLF